MPTTACRSGHAWRDTRRELKEYRENQPEYEVRAVKHRERILNPT